jgi:hypothetical protein
MRYLVGLVLALALVASPLGVTAQAEDEGKAAESTDVAKPASGLQRWHPEAFVEPTDSAQSSFELEYVPAEGPERTNRRRRRAIALGVTIPIVIAGIGLGIGAAVAMSNWEMSWD